MRLTANRVFAYLFSFLLPPMILGFLFTLGVARQVMIHPEPEPIPGITRLPASPQPDPKKLNAIIVMTNSGTQISDLMIAYEVLSTAGTFNVITAAPKRDLSITTGALAVVPDTTLAHAPLPDLLVIPSVTDYSQPELLKWVREKSEESRLILSLGEGSRLLAQTGLLSGRQATSHFVALDDLEQKYRDIKVIRDKRFVADGKILTSAGIAASFDATLYAIERLMGRDLAEQTAGHLGASWNKARSIEMGAPSQLRVSDLFRMLLHGGYDWSRTNMGVFLYPGVSEMGLAAALDTYPRSLSARTVTLAQERTLLRTKHGMTIVPVLGVKDSPILDLLVVPKGAESKKALEEAEVHQWIVSQQLPVKDFAHSHSHQSFERHLDFLAQLEGSAITRFVAKMVGLEWTAKDGNQSDMPPLTLLIRPFLIGLLGLLGAYFVDRKIVGKSAQH